MLALFCRGYMAPEYALWGYLTYKADVYSFGVFALEIVAGRSNTNFKPDDNYFCLLDWVITSLLPPPTLPYHLAEPLTVFGQFENFFAPLSKYLTCLATSFLGYTGKDREMLSGSTFLICLTINKSCHFLSQFGSR